MGFLASIRGRLVALGIVAILGSLFASGIGLHALRTTASATAVDMREIKQGINAMVALSDAETAFKTQVQEWKNILIRGHERESFDKYRQGFEREAEQVRRFLALADQYVREDLHEAAGVAPLLAEHGKLVDRYRAALNAWEAADPESGRKVDQAVRGVDRAFSEGLAKIAQRASQSEVEHLAAQISAAEAHYVATRNILAVTMVLATLTIAVLSFALIRAVTRPVSALQATMHAVRADWNLRIRADVSGRDELSAVAGSLNDLLQHFQEVVGQINAHVGKLVTTSGGVANSVSEISRNVGRQNEATTSVAASIEELTTSIERVRASAEQTQQIAESAAQLAAGGGAVIEKSAQEMIGTVDSVQAAATAVETVGQQSAAISGIVAVIREVAEQTNLLALNAAIEAARAGEQGRGFAVVADEVRKLAERTSQATRQISDNIASIQASATTAVECMRGVRNQVDGGATLARQAGEAIVKIRAGAVEVVDVASGITLALREQASASQLIARQIENIAHSSEGSTQALRQSAQAVQAMEQLAGTMRESVARFAG